MSDVKQINMDEIAFGVSDAELDEQGNPTENILSFDLIKQEMPNYKWVNIEYEDKKYAVKVLKGDPINFLDTLDDPDKHLLDEAARNDRDENHILSTDEKIAIHKGIRVSNVVILQNFILNMDINDDNLDEIPRGLQEVLLKAYRKVNGLDEIDQAVPQFQGETSDE